MVLAVLVVVFSVQNADPVHIRVLTWQGDISLAILLITTFILGALVGALYYGLTMRQKKNSKKDNIARDIPFEKEKKQEEIEADE